MSTAAWLGASAGYAAQAGQANQFLGSHGSTWLYGGTAQAAQSTGSGLYVSTASRYLAQQFTTGSAQTAIGLVYLQVSAVGGSPTSATIPPLTVDLYASSNGVPTGPALASVTVPEQYVYTSPFWLPIPLAATGLTPSTPYQIVAAPAGGSAAYYAWQRSNQPSGASTSGNGTTWTSQSYGLMYQVYDQSATPGSVPLPVFLLDDNGARWTQFTYSGGLLTGLAEYAATQNGAGQYQARTFTYSGTTLIGVN